MNGYALFEALQRAAAARRRPKPLLAMISCSADATKAQEAGGAKSRRVRSLQNWVEDVERSRG